MLAQADYYIANYRETVTIPKEEYEMLKNKLVFSEDEKPIGTFINGKKIYRKTFNCSVYWNKSIDYRDTGIKASDYDIEDLIDMHIYRTNGWGTMRPTIFRIDNDHIKYFFYSSGSDTYVDEMITIEYTKTTD